ncbi:hypothetical protein TNCT_574821 [Trichonephila clavata]|uniref:Uncharacterized protein n=1 Tax=Trichonephila clavata TaxID=2740835 RepID=A0A8X6KBD4_TRICU|nr:hypothetical protein TNCT_574821 [Trichonephila clavata]
MHENVSSVDTDFCSEFFHRPVNVVPWRNEHYATPPHMPGKRVAVRPSRMHQNVRSVGSESFQSPVNVVPWQNEHYATPSHIPARPGRSKTILHSSERKVGGYRALF